MIWFVQHEFKNDKIGLNAKVMKEFKIFTGKLKYRDIDFTFVFDKRDLRLIPPDEKRREIRMKWWLKEKEKGRFVPAEPIIVEEEYLVGKCNETNSQIVFIPQLGSYIKGNNEIVLIELVAYIIFKNNEDYIDRVAFSCTELNFIHPIEKAYQLEIPLDEYINNGIFSVITRSFDDTTTDKKHFTVDGKNVSVNFGISRKTSTKINEPPLQLNTSMFFCFDKTNDYGFIYRLYRIALEFICFLCYRKNIKMSGIELAAPSEDGKHCPVASMFIMRQCEMEEQEIIKEQRVIKQDYISGYEGKILNDIADNKLYIRHMPESYMSGRHMTAARFVMITAAFEWEFRRLFPSGIPKSEKRNEAEKKVRTTIEQYINDSTGREKEIYKFLSKLVGNNSLKDEIIYIGKKLSEIVSVFGERLYRNNGIKELKYDEIGNRLANQRNNFAHGNLDEDFIGDSLLDLMFLEYIIYAVQLKKYGIEDKAIRKSINDLFHLNFMI